MIYCIGTINADGTVTEEGTGLKHNLPVRGTADDGNPEVLLDAQAVHGRGEFQRQSVTPYIGMKVHFVKAYDNSAGYNFTIIKNNK